MIKRAASGDTPVATGCVSAPEVHAGRPGAHVESCSDEQSFDRGGANLFAGELQLEVTTKPRLALSATLPR